MEALQRDRTTVNPTGDSNGAATWKPLRFLAVYRLALTSLLAVLFFSDAAGGVLGGTYPGLYSNVVLTYVLLSIITTLTTFLAWPEFKTQVVVQIIGDIALITLLIHASGGVLSGLGTMLVVSLAAGGLLLPGRIAYLFAAVASVAILGETLYLSLSQHLILWASIGHAGLLGAAYFTTAIMTHLLSQRTQESEALAARQEVDLANLTRLNEFVIQHMDAGVIVIDNQQTIRLINATAEKLLNLNSDSSGKNLKQVSHSLEQRLKHWQNRLGENLTPIQITPTGPRVLPKFQSLTKNRDAGAVIFLEDPIQLAHQAQQLKLAAIGRLTSSIAHEIRNPLGAISHAGQLLQESPHLLGSDQRMTEIIRQQCKRVNTIVENILQLSRKETSHGKEFHLNDWLNGFAREICGLEKIASEQIHVQVEPPDLMLCFDIGHLHQIMWNLCTNALQHARPASGPVKLLLRGEISDSGHPALIVSDNGTPLDEKVQQRLFEPFYTTKSTGTGLGLYIARELCEHNKAGLEFYSAPDAGNIFHISFAKP